MNAYLILDIEIHDLNVFLSYVSEMPTFLKKHYGRYVVLGGEA